jgi:predicted O-methyltransferase YrrM
MAEERWAAVERYVTELLVKPDSVLEATLRASDAAGLPQINVGPNHGKLLMLLAQLCGARTILEIGTLGAYSTIWLARALPGGGRLITLEADPKHAEVARANIARAGLAHVVELRLGRALDTLPQLAAEGRGPFDLIFIDADKPSNPDYFTWALKLSRRGSVIVVDNVVRDGAVADAAGRDPSVLGVRRLDELIACEPRVSATAIQTVGSKGYGGFALILVTQDVAVAWSSRREGAACGTEAVIPPPRRPARAPESVRPDCPEHPLRSGDRPSGSKAPAAPEAVGRPSPGSRHKGRLPR